MEDQPSLKSGITGKRNSVNKRTLSCMHVKVMDCWKIKRADNWTSLKVLKWYSFILWLALFVVYYEMLWILTPGWTVVLNCPGNWKFIASAQNAFVDTIPSQICWYIYVYMISKWVGILSTILHWNSTMCARTQHNILFRLFVWCIGHDNFDFSMDGININTEFYHAK